ncbi:hypothetical protein SETIT_9G030900v2 [Setaria italica]|uniref:Uncharacterized protein n=1 Tax=Setaria italica TaxID=4555 RepID=A0A368SCK2_SETIT|nr:hypothetical protein SETIT_9G030900v2 [Setaria italica]
MKWERDRRRCEPPAQTTTSGGSRRPRLVWAWRPEAMPGHGPVAKVSQVPALFFRCYTTCTFPRDVTWTCTPTKVSGSAVPGRPSLLRAHTRSTCRLHGFLILPAMLHHQTINPSLDSKSKHPVPCTTVAQVIKSTMTCQANSCYQASSYRSNPPVARQDYSSFSSNSNATDGASVTTLLV